MPPLGGVLFYIGLYREIHLKLSLSKTTELISGSIFGEWGLKCAKIKGLAPFGAQKEVTIGEIWISANYSPHKPPTLMHCYLK